MRDVICQSFCSYYKSQKDEAEKCLAFELLNAWSTWVPNVVAALVSAFETGSIAVGADSLTTEPGCSDDIGSCGNRARSGDVCPLRD